MPYKSAFYADLIFIIYIELTLIKVYEYGQKNQYCYLLSHY